jgi:protein O-mannosyl-transferase
VALATDVKSGSRGIRPLLLAALVFLVTLAVYLPVVRNGFVEWDDPFTVRDNPHLRSLDGDNLRWMFQTTFWGHYQPLVWLSYAGDRVWAAALLGDGGKPAAYHLTSVLWHAAAAALLALLALRLVAALAPPGIAAFAAATAALFYALHPLRVEAVAWATGRGDMLVTVFLLAAALAYLRSRDPARSSRTWFATSLAIYGLALLSRGTATMFPLALVALDILPLRRLGSDTGWFSPAARRVWFEKLPFLGLAAVFSVLAVNAKASVGTLTSLAQHGPLARLVQACYGVVFYLVKTVVPTGLSPIYEIRLPLRLGEPRFVASVVVVVLLAAGTLLLWRRRHAVSLAAFAYVLLLLPVLGFGQAGNQLAADRYATQAAIPLSLLAAAGLAVWLRAAPRPRLRVVGTTVAVVLAVLAVLSIRQGRVWHDTGSLWEQAVKESPDSSIAQNGEGWVLLQAKRYPEAEQHFRRAIELQPSNDKAHENLWSLLSAQGRNDDLLAALRDATRVFPTYAAAHYHLGTFLQRSGQREEAIGAFQTAVRLDPGLSRARSNLGQLLLEKGDAAGAVAQFEQALAKEPNDAIARYRLATALRQQGRREEAVRQLKTILQADPQNRSAAELLNRWNQEGS